MQAFRQIELELKKSANPDKAKILQRFFKTGKGEYGEGDKFLGIIVPQQRELAKKYWQKCTLQDLSQLLKSKYHECRLTGLLIAILKYEKGDKEQKDQIYKWYLNATRHINNWDLVDLSAPNIVGEHLQKLDRKILYKLARSKYLWERRISVLATFAFIKQGSSRDALLISKLLINDPQDLIHKATGWMLREAGKRCSKKALLDFLDQNAKKMPRTMLRYAIERLPENIRQQYLNQ